jgi:hydroxymethylbilane synthase
MTSPNVRVVTRGSALALAQTTQLVDVLRSRNPDYVFTIQTLATTGDKVTDKPLSQFRGIGVFVKELERALADNEADLAVHSLKDVPVERVSGLTLAAFPPRKEPFDVLLTKDKIRFENLPRGAVIGTSSPRRFVQLKSARPDLAFADLRGNLDTRIRKLEDGAYTGIIAAAAGMARLGKAYPNNGILPFEICLPAAGQGCLAVECRESDEISYMLARTVDHDLTRTEVCAERDFLKAVGGGCQTPIAVYAKVNGDTLTISAMIGDPESVVLLRDALSVPVVDCTSAGTILAQRMAAQCEKNNIRISR